MTSAERKDFVKELLDADFTQAQLEKYLKSSLNLSPSDYKEMLEDVRGASKSEEKEEKEDEGIVSEQELDEYLDEAFPKETEEGGNDV